MKSFTEATQAAALEGPHEHECPSCGRKWKHEEPRCDVGMVRVCPALSCLDKFLRERHGVPVPEHLQTADVIALGAFLEDKGV